MADWNSPVLTDLYTDFLTFLKSRDVDAITLCVTDPTNKPTGTIRYNRSTNVFEEWSGSAWVTKVLALAGGGTGGTDAATSRTALGLGSMAVQNATGIAVTGGTVTGLTQLQLSCDLTFNADDTRVIGADATRAKGIWLRDYMVIPVGTDKWAP